MCDSKTVRDDRQGTVFTTVLTKDGRSVPVQVVPPEAYDPALDRMHGPGGFKPIEELSSKGDEMSEVVINPVRVINSLIGSGVSQEEARAEAAKYGLI